MQFKRVLSTWLFVSLVSSLLSAIGFSQSTEKKRPKLKDFGSSLERLKWDPATKTAVETKQRNSSNELNEGDVVQIQSNLVTSDVLVVDETGKLVQSLTAADFTVTEDGQPQKVDHFSRGDSGSVSRSIVLIIDYAGCYPLFLRRSIQAAKLLVDKLAPEDVMAIVTDDVELLVDFTSDKKKLKNRLDSLWNNHIQNIGSAAGLYGIPFKIGKGLAYSALMATLKEAFIQEDLRPIIIFQTDGQQVYTLKDAPTVMAVPDLPDDVRAEDLRRQEKYKSEKPNKKWIAEFSLADVIRTVEKTRATVYTVVPDLRVIDRTPDQQLKLMKKRTEIELSMLQNFWPQSDLAARRSWDKLFERRRRFSPANLMWQAQYESVKQDALSTISERAGGWTEFLEMPEDADGAYKRILTDVNHRYVIGYYPTNKAHDGTRRKIKFEVKGHPEYQVHGRTSYYAPSDK